MRVYFPHGLGDCANFAHQLPLYVRRGHEITVVCNPDKAFVFRASGVAISHERRDEPVVAWREGIGFEEMKPDTLWAANKPAVNLGLPPMPRIGSPQELWKEYCAVRLDLRPFVPREDWTAVRAFLDPLPRPVVLLHTKGNSCQAGKSLPDALAAELYAELLEAMPGTIMLLDWDNRVPRLANYRVRHLTDDWQWLHLPRLMALLYEADLLLGIDSGPLHAARFTDTPAIGMFPTAGHYPVRWCVPRDRQVNVVPTAFSRAWNKRARIAFNLVECPGDQLNAKFLAQVAARVLDGPRYFGPAQIGADVQLQQFVLDWERGAGSPLSSVVDRHRSFDRLLLEIRRRFESPLIVETGCIRAEEDWRGAGYSTYLLGALLQRYGGQLISLDDDPRHVGFAVGATAEMDCISVECVDSVKRLAEFGQPIDVLFLDSLDTTAPGFAEHALREAQAAEPWLPGQSLIMLDDTVYRAGAFHGKGQLAVPWLLDRGWRVVYSGFQTLLARS
jgi:hypothetical protein